MPCYYIIFMYVLICIFILKKRNWKDLLAKLRISQVTTKVVCSYLSHVMRKPVCGICEQQRRRSTCASAQSDQHLYFRCLDNIIPLVSTSKTSSLYLASVAEQAGLGLPWSQTPKTRFLVTRLIYSIIVLLLRITNECVNAVTKVVAHYKLFFFSESLTKKKKKRWRQMSHHEIMAL